jgi:hypothetical protein
VGAPPPATDQDVEIFAGGLSQGFLECRELRHAWRPHTASWNAEGKYYDRTLRCPRCKTLRVETLSTYGTILSRRYDYTEGYLSHERIGRIAGSGRDVLRRESLWRQLGDVTSKKAN